MTFMLLSQKKKDQPKCNKFPLKLTFWYYTFCFVNYNSISIFLKEKSPISTNIHLLYKIYIINYESAECLNMYSFKCSSLNEITFASRLISNT